MRRHRAARLAALVLAWGAAIASATAGEFQLVAIHSRLLEANPLHDPADRSIAVYLPPGYEKGSGRYPVAYYLMGYGNRVDRSTPAALSTFAHDLDSTIAAGIVRPMIVVVPDCSTRYGGSQYLDSPAQGAYASYLISELVPFVDGRFRTLVSAESRGVFGHSSGGYGALVLAMLHPDVFGAVGSLSGDSYFELTHIRFIGDFIRENPDHEPVPGRDTLRGVAPYLIGLASAYSPGRRDSTRYELPFAYPSGELVDRVWKEWLAHDPINMIERYAGNLHKLRGIYLYGGRHDEFYLDVGARVMESRLRKLGIPFTAAEDDGTHGSSLPVQRMEVLKFFSRTLVSP